MSSHRTSTIESPKLEPLEPRRLLSTGALDPAFNNGTPLTEDYHHGGSHADFVAPLPDGSFFIAGAEDIVNSNFWRIAVTKYTFDGKPDPTFGIGGSLLLSPTDLSAIDGISPTSDGGFIISGNDSDVDSEEPARLIVKYTPTGQLDTTFGKNGILQTNDLVNAGGTPGGFAIDSSGRILVGGAVGNTGVVRRYLSDGQLDATFAINGEFHITPPASTKSKRVYTDFIASILFDSQNRILLSCTQALNSLESFGPDWISSHPILDRLTPSGTLDSSFHVPSTTTAEFTDAFADYFHAVKILPDGKIIMSNTVTVAELNADGSINQSYGHAGLSGVYVFGTLLFPSDGSILATNFPFSIINTPFSFYLRRIKPNGTLDRSFGTNGKLLITTVIATDFTYLTQSTAALAPDGTLLAAANEGVATPSGLTDTRTLTLTRLFMNNSPAVQLIPRTFSSASKPTSFSLLIRDPDGIDTSSLSNSNLRLFDSDDNSTPISFRSSEDVLDDDTNTYLRATYHINNPSALANGTYTLHLMRHQISNTATTFTPAQNLGAIHINLS